MKKIYKKFKILSLVTDLYLDKNYKFMTKERTDYSSVLSYICSLLYMKGNEIFPITNICRKLEKYTGFMKKNNVLV